DSEHAHRLGVPGVDHQRADPAGRQRDRADDHPGCGARRRGVARPVATMMDGVRTGPVLCMGPIAMDMHVQAEAPADLDVLKHWIGSGAVSLQTGGSIGYTALALAGLGRRSVLRSTVGDDVFGREVLTQLTRLQVDVDGVSIAPGDTALAVYLRIFAGHKRPLVLRLPQHAPWPSEIALGEQ